MNPSAADPSTKIHTQKLASDRVLTPSRTHISSPLATAREQRPYRAPNRNMTYVIRGSCYPPQEPDPTKRARAKFPHQAQPGRVPAQWARAIRSLAPVRGLTPPSIPLPFHWRAETRSQTFSPKRHGFFFHLYIDMYVYVFCIKIYVYIYIYIVYIYIYYIYVTLRCTYEVSLIGPQHMFADSAEFLGACVSILGDRVRYRHVFADREALSGACEVHR